MSWNTQPKFFVSCTISYCTVLRHPFLTFCWAALQPCGVRRRTYPRICIPLLSCIPSTPGNATLHKMDSYRYLEDVPCTVDEIFSQTDFDPLGLLDIAKFFPPCAWVVCSGEGVGCVVAFARLFLRCRKLHGSPFVHCPLARHCQHSPCPLWTRSCSLWFLTKMFHSILPFLASKFRDPNSCSILLFTIVFNLW